MRNLVLITVCAASLSAYALPTYEPFTEFSAAIAATGTNAINLTTGAWTAPSGEQWGALNFSGTAGTHVMGLDIDVTNMTAGSVFTDTALASILPATFPGFPAAGSSINIMAVNPAQPLAPGATGYGSNPNIVGNSAVLRFAQDITRPTSETKTLFVSYLFSVAQKGQTGTGNVGRYLGFLASSNLNEGWTATGPVPGAAYTNWAALFNAYGTTATSPKYFGHGVFNGAPDYIEPSDSSAGKNPATPPTTFPVSFNQPYFIVGEFVFTTNGTASLPDTNIVWVNPSTSAFGGSAPPAAGITNPMAITMSDVGGMVLIDRVGSGALGGVGTNYIANLIIGSTWSYVTGGPEFTNQPPASTVVNIGQNASLSGAATAAGQSVAYQWVKITGGVSNNVNNGAGGAGGTATVSGATTGTLTLTGVSAGDVGNYQLVATASSTGYLLNSATTAVVLADPQIAASPANTAANYAQTANLTATATTANAPLSYRWYLGATPLDNGLQPDGSYAIGASGTTGAGTSFTLTLTLTNVSYRDIGDYSLVVTNSLGLIAFSTPASLAVHDPNIVTPPADPGVVSGGTATFTVVAAGSPTLSYQWYEGVSPLTDGGTTASGSGIVGGALTPTLSINNVSDADNGSYYCAVTSSASGQTTNSPAATLTVQDALTIVSTPKSLVERTGDHVAFAIGVAGGGPRFQWSYNTTPIPGATKSALVLTNIQPTNAGTYSVVVGNLATADQTFSSTLTVIDSTVLPLAQTNLIVARVGDGAQVLSAATGNTLYLDQYTPSGTYLNTIQVPDEGTGQPYGTGGSSSSSMPFGSPALLVAGAGADAGYEAMLSLSSGNQEFLGFAGYCQAYPFSGPDVSIGATTGIHWRGLATINAFGTYSLAYTNSGLFSGGNHYIRDMVTLGGTNYWATGSAGSGGIKFVNSTVTSYLGGNGVPGSSAASTSAAGSRTIQIVNGPLPVAGFSSVNNLVFSDALGVSGVGLYAVSGTPEPGPSATFAASPLLITGSSQPGDFAFSPDNQTLYIADAGTFTSTGDLTGGGIQRWDSNNAGGYNYSYTLEPLTGATNGAQGLTVDFSATGTWGSGVNGAKLYVTTYGESGNSLVLIVDNGASSTPTVLATAGANQALRGVRFGPAAIAPAVATSPQSQTNFPGNNVTFTVAATGSAPLFYQWYYGTAPIAGATQGSFTTNNISLASAGSYSVVVSNLTTLTATSTPAILTVTAGAPTITPVALPNYRETAGDHLAWGPAVTGTLPITNYWYFGSTLVQSNVNSGASASLILTNIQIADSGAYTLIASNVFGRATSSATLTVTPTLQTLSSNNLVVARIGDGAQPLSGATGNTLYLDQYTTSGGYSNTIQIPDEGTGLPYGTGSSSSASMPFGSRALLFAGAGLDAGYEAFLTRAPNGQSLGFAGYCEAYPFTGADLTVGANGGANWRGVAGVNAYGYYTLSFTNTGLYSGGGHQIHGAADLDGSGTNFYATGEAGSGAGVKYLNINLQPASGGGLVSVAGTFGGTRVARVINGNLVFSDTGGIYACSGLPTTAATATLQIAETNSPMDFAQSPDGNTAYVADNSVFQGTSVPAGGIQRWDNVGGTWTHAYTLATGSGSTVGGRGLTVDFSAQTAWGQGVVGAVLYATTAEASGNRLVRIVDNGATSIATLLTAASPNQILAGVDFGPTIVAPSFASEPQSVSDLAGSTVTFSANAVGSGPLTYQWFFQANGVGAFIAIASATNATYSFSPAGSANVGNYFVVVTNPGSLTAQSQTVSFTLEAAPHFTSEVYLGAGSGIQLNFTGPAGKAYSIWTSSDLALRPIQSAWTKVATGSFSGGTDSVQDPSGGASPQQFYIITVP